MQFDDLTDEQKSKVSECATPEEILALARDEGYELTEEELESVAGGGNWYERTVYIPCYNCNKKVWYKGEAPTNCPYCLKPL